MAKRRPPVGVLIALGALGVAGVFAGRAIARRRREAAGRRRPAPVEENTGEIRVRKCPKCGADVKEYEFFCADCGAPLDDAPR
ncbi:MAG: hypothetical protein AB1742_11935 [bacterium]